MHNKVEGYRKLIMSGDLNGAGSLFGGTLCSFIDEACALYVMCQLKTKNVVTVNISDITFKEPVILNDFISIETSTLKIGTTSITVDVKVLKKDLTSENKTVVTTCTATFVSIDPITKKKIPHGVAPIG